MIDKLPTAIILAAGEGSRLRPYTEILPKALFPVGDKPCIRWIVDDLTTQDFKDIRICVNEKELGLFQHEFRDDRTDLVKITFSTSSKPLGTCGEILNCLKHSVTWPILVIYADDLTYTNYKQMLILHKSVTPNGFIGTLGVTNQNKLEVGIIKESGNHVDEFYEKPNIGQFGWTSWTGRALFESGVLQYMKEGRDIASDVFPLIKGKLFCFKSDSEWLDIGNIQHYKRANEKARSGKLW
jgi:NDP-mannose synthase